MALNGAALMRDIMLWNTASHVVETSHSFNAASSLASRYETLGGFLGVTYEYNNNSGTNPTRLNSLVLGTDTFNKQLYMNGSSSLDKDWRYIKFYIPEDNPVLKQSAFVFHNMAAGGGTLGVQEGHQQLSRSYTLAAFVGAGGTIVHHRIDHSSTLSLAKGENVLTSTFLAAAANSIGQWGHWAYVNYTSDCSPLGEGAHNHTTAYCIISSSIALGANYGEIGGPIIKSASIPENKYFLNSSIYEYCLRNTNNMDFGCQMSLTVSEYNNSGWTSVIPFTLNWSDGELHPIKFWNEARDIFNQYPEQTGTLQGRADIRRPRRYRSWVGVAGPWYLKNWVTYHSITSSVNGTITGSAGGVVDLKLIRLNDFTTVMGTQRTGNGAFSMSWYDSSADGYIVMARETANNKGISAAGTPGSSVFDIVLSSSGGTASSGSTTIVASNYAFIG